MARICDLQKCSTKADEMSRHYSVSGLTQHVQVVAQRDQGQTPLDLCVEDRRAFEADLIGAIKSVAEKWGFFVVELPPGS